MVTFMDISLIVHFLGAFDYAVIAYALMTLILLFLHEIPRERIKSNDPDGYSKILGDNSWLFDSGGGSPADIGAYYRFFSYVVSHDAKRIIGKRFWIFYRITTPLYLLSKIWFVLSIVISMVTA